MRPTSSRILIDRGRKAGLGTGELYSALVTLRPRMGDGTKREADGNGFVSAYTGQGQRIYRPAAGHTGS